MEVSYDFSFEGIMSFDWKYHKWTYINNLEGTGEKVIFQANCFLKIKFIEANFNANFSDINLQKHVEIHLSDFQLKKISTPIIQNVTDIVKYDHLYKQVGPLISSGSFEEHLGDHFKQAYDYEVDRIFDDRFFSNQSFYWHPIFHDFYFFDQRVVTANKWYFFLTQGKGIQMNVTEQYMFFQHAKVSMKNVESAR